MKVIRNGNVEEMKDCQMTVASIFEKKDWYDILNWMEMLNIEAFEDYNLSDVSTNSMITKEYILEQIDECKVV